MFKNLNFNDKEKKKLIALLSVGLVCLIAVLGIDFMQNKDNSSGDDKKNATSVSTAKEDAKKTSSEKQEEDLEKKLTKILKQINGAGDVNVMITYENSKELEPAYNSNSTNETTSETDSSGGERTVTTSSENKTIVTSESSKPIIVRTTEAKIKGVIVVSSGATNAKVKETLYDAVQTALQISGHQVEVYAK